VNERSDEGVQIKRCGICYLDVPENEWIEHLKSPSHKRNTKLIKDELKEKVKSFNIRRQRRRNFQNVDFETNDYIVKKSEEALERCFLTLRITPKNDINSVYVLKEELPDLMFERMKDILQHKTAVKLQIVLKGKFRKFHPATGR
jgi:predicted DCC family thiol-disulfide oxidoreductase YuxK